MALTSTRQVPPETCAIENGFPIGLVSRLAEHESWRKEIYRPLSYIHKWWARRLGSVFRALILGSALEADADVGLRFYKTADLSHLVVFDPFMGSGTTVTEAVKLGCRTIGRDINPVAAMMVQTALQRYSPRAVFETYAEIERACAQRIRALYQSRLPDGTLVEVLYFFWVKTLDCPSCAQCIDLFKSRIFAQNAMPLRKPEAYALCPHCQAVNEVRYDATSAICPACSMAFNPQIGSTAKNVVTCPACDQVFRLIDRMRRQDQPLAHRLYAKMVWDPRCGRVFLATTPADLALYGEAAGLLESLRPYIPQEAIEPGHNTQQALNYNYRHWHQMFNQRQLACLAMLAEAIAGIADPAMKMLFAYLLSGTLEFNNLFASFKGLGTGAVRPLFSDHILKPELMPIEANVWGTRESSGAFSGLFGSRVIPALRYKEAPFELQISGDKPAVHGSKVYGLSRPIEASIVGSYADFLARPGSVYLSTGDSSRIDLPDGSVDLVVTDPPFFDNVHYSELADFFYVWLRRILGPGEPWTPTTTRAPGEVQHTDVETFAGSLAAVFGECARVLKDAGLLVFTYHHSRIEGWAAVYSAIRAAGFCVTQSHPVKAEMAVSVSIQKAKIPINFDLVLVCRKHTPAAAIAPVIEELRRNWLAETHATIAELQAARLPISEADAWVILMGRVLVSLSTNGDDRWAQDTLRQIEVDGSLLSTAEELVEILPAHGSRPTVHSLWAQNALF